MKLSISYRTAGLPLTSFILAVLSFALSGCAGSVSTPLQVPANQNFTEEPAGPSEPSTPTAAPTATPSPGQTTVPASDGSHSTYFCAPDASGHFGQTARIAYGQENGHDFGLGGGCVARPLREVWAVMLNWPLMQWKGVDDSQAQAMANPPTDVELYYKVHYHVERFFVNVEWWMDWYHVVKRGTVENPEKILINFQKVDGTDHIQYWVGSVFLEKISDEVTSFGIHVDVNADQQGPEDQGKTVQEVYDKLKKGEPDWDSLPK